MSKSAVTVVCDGCKLPRAAFGGIVCPSCKRRQARQQEAREAQRRREQEARGRVGDEERAKAAIASFDAFSRAVREAAGVPVGGGR